jgi:hypothetical protein
MKWILLILCLTIGIVTPATYDQSLAYRCALIAAASYCSTDAINGWTCQACKLTNESFVFGTVHDPLSDTFGITVIK